MPAPEISKIKSSTRKIVKKAKKEGKLSQLTARIIRHQVEDEFSLEQGTLDANDFKTAVKDALKAAMEEDTTSEEEAKPVVKPAKKRKSDSKDNTELVSKKPKTASTEKASGTDKPGKRKTSEPKGKYKSLAMVPTSDIEDDGGVMEPVLHPVVASTSHLSSGSAKENKHADTTPMKKVSKEQESSKTTSKAPARKEAEENESELSVLVDEAPKRKKKAKGKELENKTKSKPKKGKKPAVELSKDEETIKRLKGLVLACGIRKMWAKEFKELDRPSQQIKRLKEILAELGMTGRLSLEQAKSIKERRELAQELEDVRSFEKSVVTSRSTRDLPKAGANKTTSDSEDQSGEDEAEIPTKRMNARKSIMAFLDDQSDDE